MYQLKTSTNIELRSKFSVYVEEAEKKLNKTAVDSVEQLLLPLIEEKSVKSLLRHYLLDVKSVNKVFGQFELATILGYAAFAREEMMKPSELLEVEVRIEASKAYALVPLHQSFVAEALSTDFVAWVHDEEWALDRFSDPASKNFALCGQQIGQSKFVTLVDSSSNINNGTNDSALLFQNKDAALDKLGIRGYETFDKPGSLYVVQVPMAEIPYPVKVPLVYMSAKSNENAKTSTKSWNTVPGFQEGTIPGFTKGLCNEVIMETFQVQVTSVDELNRKGIFCTRLID